VRKLSCSTSPIHKIFPDKKKEEKIVFPEILSFLESDNHPVFEYKKSFEKFRVPVRV
jgi:hypothetical protein